MVCPVQVKLTRSMNNGLEFSLSFRRPIKLVVAKCWDPTPKGYFTIPRSELGGITGSNLTSISSTNTDWCTWALCWLMRLACPSVTFKRRVWGWLMSFVQPCLLVSLFCKIKQRQLKYVQFFFHSELKWFKFYLRQKTTTQNYNNINVIVFIFTTHLFRNSF